MANDQPGNVIESLCSRTQKGDQLTSERYEPKKAPPEQSDTVLAGPSQA
jgi:hypothetical protein